MCEVLSTDLCYISETGEHTVVCFFPFSYSKLSCEKEVGYAQTESLWSTRAQTVGTDKGSKCRHFVLTAKFGLFPALGYTVRTEASF